MKALKVETNDAYQYMYLYLISCFLYMYDNVFMNFCFKISDDKFLKKKKFGCCKIGTQKKRDNDIERKLLLLLLI